MTNHTVAGVGQLPQRLTPPLTRQRVALRLVIVLGLCATVWAWQHIDMSPMSLLSGLGDMWNLLGRMLPPSFADAGEAVRLSFETLWMAMIGTALATALSIPLAFGAARNTTPHWIVQKICRALIVATRAIPDLVFAVILVRVFSIGILPGVLALGLHSIGMVGKLFADAIEQIDETPREAVTSVGARKWSTIITAVVPQVLPSFIGTALYRLDINLRTATVLGFVGAGGIGQLLKTLLGQLQYSRALGVVIVLVVFVIGVELLATAVRKNLIGDGARPGGHRGVGSRRGRELMSTMTRRLRQASPTRWSPPDVTGGASSRTAGPSFDHEKLTPPWTPQRVRMSMFTLTFAVLLIAAFVFTKINPLEIITGVPDMWDTAGRMLPPDFTTVRGDLIAGMTETLAIGIVGAAIGFTAALPIGLLAARNVSPNGAVYAATRMVLVLVRAIPDLVLVVIFVAAMGLGPTPGVIALSISTATFMARLVADAVEEVDPNPREAVVATGASRLQETFTSVLPQAMPGIVAHLMYTFDVNIRASTIIGMTGAGGIGFLLQNSVRVLQWQTTAAIIISIFALVYAIELLAGWIRKQIL